MYACACVCVRTCRYVRDCLRTCASACVHVCICVLQQAHASPPPLQGHSVCAHICGYYLRACMCVPRGALMRALHRCRAAVCVRIKMGTRVYVCMYVCMRVHACMCVCACVHACICVCACVRASMCVCACVHACMCVCACVHACMCTCACMHVCVCLAAHSREPSTDAGPLSSGAASASSASWCSCTSHTRTLLSVVSTMSRQPPTA